MPYTVYFTQTSKGRQTFDTLEQVEAFTNGEYGYQDAEWYSCEESDFMVHELAPGLPPGPIISVDEFLPLSPE